MLFALNGASFLVINALPYQKNNILRVKPERLTKGDQLIVYGPIGVSLETSV